MREVVGEEMAKLKQVLGADRYDGGHFKDAVELFLQVATPPEFIDFLTLPAYQRVTTVTGKARPVPDRIASRAGTVFGLKCVQGAC